MPAKPSSPFPSPPTLPTMTVGGQFDPVARLIGAPGDLLNAWHNLTEYGGSLASNLFPGGYVPPDYRPVSQNVGLPSSQQVEADTQRRMLALLLGSGSQPAPSSDAPGLAAALAQHRP